ncbi:hypothetical protein AMTRI_Chr09g41600 [Amborella trichopoda]
MTTSPVSFPPEPALASAPCPSPLTSRSSPSPSTSLTDTITHSQGDHFGLSSGIFRQTEADSLPFLVLPAIPSPLPASLGSSLGGFVSVDTMGDTLSPPSVDSKYFDSIDAGKSHIQDIMKVMGFPQPDPDEHFQEFFKAELQDRVRVSKKGSRKLANLACSINYDRTPACF